MILMMSQNAVLFATESAIINTHAREGLPTVFVLLALAVIPPFKQNFKNTYCVSSDCGYITVDIEKA